MTTAGNEQRRLKQNLAIPSMGAPAASLPFSIGDITSTPTLAPADSTASSHGIAITKDRHPPSDGIINKTLFKCRKCKLLFWTTHEAASHEQACREPHWYNCSVCQVLRFPSREERAIHQRTCPGLTPLRIADLPLAERIVSKRGAFDLVTDDAPSNVVATDPADAVRNTIEKAGREGVIGTTQGSARTAERSSSSGVQHKSALDCELSVVRTKMVPFKSSSSERKLHSERSSSKGECEKIDGPLKDETNYPEAKATVSTASLTQNNSKTEMEWTTVWTCDVCKQEQFDTYEAAVNHEKKCKGKKLAPLDPSLTSAEKCSENATRAAAGAAALASEPSTKKPKENKIILFSPVLKDSSDSSNFFQISKHHRLILKSLQLLYLPTASGKGPVLFQCQFCSRLFSPGEDSGSGHVWTLGKIVETLPSLVFTHITSSCKSANRSDEAMQLPMAKTSGKMPFDEFLPVFFSENGIMENTDEERGVVVLSDEEFRKMPGSEKSKRGKLLFGGRKKRGRPSGPKSAAAKRQKATKTSEPTSKKIFALSKHKKIKYGDMGCKFHIEEGAQFCLGPLDGLPFLSSFSREASKELLPAEKFLLQQVELFTLYPALIATLKIIPPAPCVGIRCRNCIADKDGCCFMKLSSVDTMVCDVFTMAMEHVMSCKFMKAKDVKLLQDLKPGAHSSSLAKYCKYVAKLYSLDDSKNDRISGVVWGESPKVPTGEYSNPMDIDVGSFFKNLPCELDVEAPLLKVMKKSGDGKQTQS